MRKRGTQTDLINPSAPKKNETDLLSQLNAMNNPERIAERRAAISGALFGRVEDVRNIFDAPVNRPPEP